MNATYSPEDNKLRLYPDSRLDPETYAHVRKQGFIWAPKQSLFVAPMWTPERADFLVEMCGDIDDEDRSLVDRAEDRSERFETYSEKRAIDAKRAHEAVSAIADNIPLGQPILVGHHSERHARKDAERIENGMRRTLKMWETSEYWRRRAAGAIAHAKYKELPAVRARRIKTIEADKRRSERVIAESQKWLKAWRLLTAPAKSDELRPGVVAMDAPPASPEIQLQRAIAIANYSRVRLPHGDPRGWSLWSALTDGKMTPREALLMCCKHYGRCIRHAKRWIAHYDNRLTYERAMLDEQGATHLLAKKPKSAKAQLPLCNYRAPEGIRYANIYHRGQSEHVQQIEMTAAEYARISNDYKATRVVDNSHRVRTCMRQHSIYAVFLTDSKVHERPPAVEPVLPEPRPMRAYVPREKTEAEIQIEALREGVKAGVQVVTAPQLFPTPADVARQVVALADIEPGMCVLEPSAGTGSLCRAIVESVDTEVRAIEINPALCSNLRREFPSYRVHVEQADFLTVSDFQGQYPRVVMNPPFANGSDIKHIQHARKFLAPGGRLVAICANGPRQADAFKDEALEWIDLPSGTFDHTDVRAAIIVLEAAE